MENLGAILPLLIIVVAFFLLVLRPARARQRAFVQTQSGLAPGNQVMLSSGIFGEIVSLGDDTASVRIAEGTVVTVSKQAIARVVPPEEPQIEAGTDD